MKSYRVWDPETRKVVRARDVAFEKETEEIGEIFGDEKDNEANNKEIQTNTNQGGENDVEEVIDETSEGNQEENTINEETIEEAPTERVRASTRSKRPVEKYGNWTTYLSIKKELEENTKENYEAMALQTFVRENTIVPDSFKKAKESNEWPSWRKAIFAELDSIIENGVLELVQKESRDKNKTLINTRWVLNKKFDTEGNLKR